MNLRIILLTLLAVCIVMPSMSQTKKKDAEPYNTSREIYKYELDEPIKKAVADSAIYVRENELCNAGVICFDGQTDENGNEIFRVDLTFATMDYYRAKDIFAYTVVANCIINIKETEAANRHITKVNCKNNFFCHTEYCNFKRTNGIGANMEFPLETFYFVITDDGIHRYYPQEKTQISTP